MRSLDELLTLLVKHEGLRLHPYVCPAGYLTIGVGHNIEANPLKEPFKSYLHKHGKITEAMALEILMDDVMTCISEASANLKCFMKLDLVRHDVVVSMIFNLGIGRFLGFKNMIRCLEVADYEGASREMLLSKWRKQVGRRALELSVMMLSGKRSEFE